LTFAVSVIGYGSIVPSPDEGRSYTDQLETMREFTDSDGRAWSAFAVEERGTDYKGRLHLVLRPTDGGEDGSVELRDVRWNSERTARRTLETMSVVELRRRLRSAVGRSASQAVT
jgi:hypothetical protein